jgi:hypothetical protein
MYGNEHTPKALGYKPPGTMSAEPMIVPDGAPLESLCSDNVMLPGEDDAPYENSTRLIVVWPAAVVHG